MWHTNYVLSFHIKMSTPCKINKNMQTHSSWLLQVNIQNVRKQKHVSLLCIFTGKWVLKTCFEVQKNCKNTFPCFVFLLESGFWKHYVLKYRKTASEKVVEWRTLCKTTISLSVIFLPLTGSTISLSFLMIFSTHSTVTTLPL